MKTIGRQLRRRTGLAMLWLAAAASPAWAATSRSNSFTGFTGDSTQVATQNSVAAAGFNFYDHESISKVKFSAAGATFGDGVTDSFGDAGRNYIRTNDADYANVSFVAEVTMTIPDNSENFDLLGPSGYFGLGSGDADPLYRTPEYQTELSSVMYWGDITDNDFPYLANMRNTDFRTITNYIDAPDFTFGAHRLRLSYDWFHKTMQVSLDAQYAGGPFVADYVMEPVDTLDLYGPTGWPGEAARIYFGGDQGMSFKDFQVTVTSPSMLIGDFNMSGTVTGADWVILRSNLGVDLSGMTPAQAFALGDMNGDLIDDRTDFTLFKTVYEDANGAGSFALLGGVPEPSGLALIASAGLASLGAGRRRAHCAKAGKSRVR